MSLPIAIVLVQLAVEFVPIAIESCFAAFAFPPTAIAWRPAVGLGTLFGAIFTASLVVRSAEAIAD